MKKFIRAIGFGLTKAAMLAGLTFGAMTLGAERASALPSFARQTGQTCSACHTAFPQLTPFGRRFKLGGYTLEGGDTKNLPPLSVMLQSTFTHYNRGLDEAPGGAYAPPSPNGGFPDTNNFLDLSQQASFFVGGKIYGNVGAFSQWTYSNGYGRTFGMDNTDIRYADTTKIGNVDVLYGLTANNKPTVQDVWNTTPAWGVPFIDSAFSMLGGVASTTIESLSPGQTLGGGAYVFIDDTYYAEISAYGSPAPRVQSTLGVSQLGFTITGPAPYYRLAAEKNIGDHSFMIGTYGLYASVIPNGQGGFGFGTDRIFDAGFDSQYQWIADEHAVTLRANYIFERQNLGNTFQFTTLTGPPASNNVDYLRSLKLSAEYVYDHTYAVSGTFFQITGSPDAAIFGSNVNTSPNSSGFIFDVAYLPFSKGGPEFWPWLNTRIGVSYTAFTKYNGGISDIDAGCPGCRRASDNNTLLLYAFTAF